MHLSQLSLTLVATLSATSWNLAVAGPPAPPVGAFCAGGSAYDSANCYFGRPQSGNAFIYDRNFYATTSTPGTCPSPLTWDSANCYLRPIPAGQNGFIYQNGWYTDTNPHFSWRSSQCPSGTTLRGANCYKGTAPSGHEALIRYGNFGFKRSFYANCSRILPGSSGTLDPTFCKVSEVPSGHTAFVFGDRWYTEPTPGGTPWWTAKTYRADSAQLLRPLCLQDSSSRSWSMVWSEDFDDQPDGRRCYTSSAEAAQCVYRAWWGFTKCTDAPTSWNVSARMRRWTPEQQARWSGVVNLNKCRWQIYDQMNQWDSLNPEGERTNSFKPENIQISGGVLKMKTQAEPATSQGWDCGRQIEPDPDNKGRLFTKRCPHSGATISSMSGLPWTQANDPDNTNPDSRFVGLLAGYGRIEFRAKIGAIGHGAWPALWLWGDDDAKPKGIGELDALEYLADTQAGEDQITRGAATSGIAMQTVHNWGVDSEGYPHTSDGLGIPVNTGEWHTYSIEVEPTEIRVYLDGCLRNRLREGDEIYIAPWDRPQDQPNAPTFRPFKLPGNRKYHVIIGNPASAAHFLPLWYRAYGGSAGLAKPGFKPTTIEVDYVRYYARPAVPAQ